MDANVELAKRPTNVSELKRVLETVVQREIVYDNYANNDEKIMLGHKILKTVETIQKKWAKGLVNLGDYSPFVLGDRIPSWQVDLWEPFLTPDNLVTLDNFHDYVWLLLKSRQIGFSYVMFRLQTALALTIPKCRCLLGAKDKTWISSIMDNIAPAVLPFRDLYPAEKNSLFREMGISHRALFFNRISLTYGFPEEALIKLLGIDTISDKNRGLGNVSLISIDEAAYVDNASIITTVLKPMLNFNQGSFIFGSTPNGDNWFKKYVDDCKADVSPRFKINQYDLYTCGIYSESESDKILWNSFEDYLRINATMEPYEAILLIAQEYLYHFNNYGKKQKYYPAFSRDPSLYTYMGRTMDYSDKSKFECYVSIDYGGTSDPMAVVFLAVDRAGRIYVFDELNLYNSGIREVCDVIRDKVKMWKIEPRAYYIDRSTTNRSIMMDKNTSVKISDFFFQNGIHVTGAHKMNKMARIDIVNEFLRADPNSSHPTTGHNPAGRLFVSDSCYTLIKQMVALEIDVNKQGLNISKFNAIKKDDVSDALLYGISEISGYYTSDKRGTEDNRHMSGNVILRRSLGNTNKLINEVNPYKVKVSRYK